jgi:hypothetical protein
MSGIAGITHSGKQPDVKRMLTIIAYLGYTREIVETDLSYRKDI